MIRRRNRRDRLAMSYAERLHAQAVKVDAEGLLQGVARDELIAAVESAAVDGEYWALATLRRWAERGADSDLNKAIKNLNPATIVRTNGTRVRATAAYSRRIVDKDTIRVIGQQILLFWDMTQPELLHLRADLAGQRDVLDVRVEALDRVLSAMDRHPDKKTARDAWEADGRSITEIDLNEAAS